MSFYPDGPTDIPEQTPIPGATTTGVTTPGGATPPRTMTQGEFQREISKVITRTSVISGVLLVAAVLLGYVFPVVEDDQAVWLVIGAALVGSVITVGSMMRAQAQRRRAIEAGTLVVEPGSPAGAAPPGGLTRGTVPPGPIPPGTPPGVAAPAGGLPYGAVADAGSPGVPPGAPPTGFSMPVEDVFSITGRGTVATGRVAAGSARVGQALQVRRDGVVVAQTRVIAVEMFRKTVDVATAGENVGLLLEGVSRSDLTRGDELVG